MNRRKRTKHSLFLIMNIMVTVVLTTSCTRTPEQAADVIYTGGDIVTINDAQPTAEGLAVKDGKIIAVGTQADILKYKGTSTITVNLNGKTLLPGFFDAHGHVFFTTLWKNSADLYPPPMGDIDNIAKLKQALFDHRDKNNIKPGEWIVGMNYDDTLLDIKRHPTRDDLDKISTEYPILIIHISAHFASANSKALEMAGITAQTKDPVGGRFIRRAGSQEPNGVMESNMAYLQVMSKMPATSLEQTAEMFADTLKNVYAANGITTAQEAGGILPPVLKALQYAADKNLLPIDVIGYPKDAYQNLLENYKEDQHYRNHFRLGGLKLIFDGSIQGFTAYLSKPYHTQPREGQTDFRGGSYYGSQEDADQLVENALKKGWHILAHTNADAATDMLIESMRKGLAKYPVKDHRTTIIHAQMMREDQLDAAKELGMIPSFFPAHIYYWGDRHRDIFVGPQRAARMNPSKSALNRGMRFTLHADAPVTTSNIMQVIQSAVNRVTTSGKSLGREFEIPVLDALKGVTINVAWQEGEDDIKGSLEVGKLADLVILSANPLKVKSTTITDIKVMETIKEGKTVYVAP